MPRKTNPSPQDENSFRGDRETVTLTKEDVGEISAELLTSPDSNHSKTPPTGGKRATERSPSMSMIDPTEWELDNSQEPYAMKDGTETLLRVIEVRKATRPETGTDYYIIRFEIPAEAYSKEVSAFLDVPARSLDAKRLNDARQRMLHFTECFGIDLSRPMDPTEDWVGCEGWCILSLTKSDQYGEQNRISKYIKPR